MRRERLRPVAEYGTPYDHSRWADHQLRVAVTIQVAHALVGHVGVAADLSCGDGAVLRSLRVDRRIHGDIAPGWEYEGPIEETIRDLRDVDLYVCTETIEHLDQPTMVLHEIRKKTGALVLSTPVDAWDDANPEHCWAWDREAVEAMLTEAGFATAAYVGLDVRPGGGEYCFGIWACR